MVTRENNLLRATIFDRNIKANDESTSLADDVRNKIYAIGGISGMSKLQWEILVGKIVEENWLAISRPPGASRPKEQPGSPYRYTKFPSLRKTAGKAGVVTLLRLLKNPYPELQ